MQIMKRITLAIVAAILTLTIAVDAAPRRRMRGISKEFSIPEGGIRIRVPAGMSIQLLPSPVVYATRKSDGVALYRTEDIWRDDQLVAMWSGQGASATLARVEYPPETRRRNTLSTIADERNRRRSFRNFPSDGELFGWAGVFFGVSATGRHGCSGRGELEWSRLETDRRNCALFFGHGTDNGELRMFMFLIDWGKTASSGDREWERLAERCAVSAKFIPLRRIEAESSGTYAERLAQARKSIAGMRNWYIRETPNYIFATNQRSRSDMRRLQNDLESARELFGRYFPPAGNRCGTGVVKLFADRQEYLRYVGEELKWTAGVWKTGERELVVSPLGAKVDDRIAEKYLREVALHEGFHQYIFYASNEVNPALWFNEGCAQFFESSLPRQGEAGVLDKNTEAKLARAASTVGDDLRDFLLLDHKGFYAEGQRERNYALAHALCYYLLRGAPAMNETKFAAIPRRYIDALRLSRNPQAAHAAAFSGINTRELAAKLKAFWRDRQQIQRARRYRGAFGRP